MEIKGLILQQTYVVEENKSYVCFYGKLENSKTFFTKNYYKPYFYIKKTDVLKLKEINSELDYELVEDTKYTNFENEELSKVLLNIPKEVPILRREFEEYDIECFEADIRFEYRFMHDHNLSMYVLIQGNAKENDDKDLKIDYLFNEPKISNPIKENEVINPNEIPELKVLSIDIETNGYDKLFSISMYSNDYEKVIFILNDKNKEKIDELNELDNLILCNNEIDALIKFKEEINKYDPDIITGWNVIDFDINFLKKKFKKYKIPMTIGRDNNNIKLRVEDNFLKESKANLCARFILDGIQILKSSYIKLEDYKLETAAQTFLNKGKIFSSENKLKKIIDSYNNNPKELIKYNLIDSKLVYEILETKDLINLSIQRTIITGMPLDRISSTIAIIDSLYLKELTKIKKVANTNKYKEKTNKQTGGYVKKPKPGIYNGVIVCDFKSLYPSIIKTFNIDPLSHIPNCELKKTTKEIIVSPVNACFKNEKGLLPKIIERLWKLRDIAKKENNQTASFAIKIHMNAIAGGLGNPNCRFYSYELANSITTFGQYIIKLAQEITKKINYEVIYGDTDSIFINLETNNIDDMKKTGKEIEEKINNSIKKEIKEKYYRESYLEIEFEKIYKKLILPYSRDKSQGTKKRYAGLKIENEKETIDIVGLEYVRRDWTELSKDFQMELLKKIFENKDPTKYIKQFVKDLKNHKYDDELTYKKSIRKKLSEYTKTTPPHIKAARILEKNNIKLESSIISYVVTKNGPEPVQLIKNEIDYEHYIEKQLKPIADSILYFYNTDFDEIVTNSSQKSLFDFGK